MKIQDVKDAVQRIYDIRGDDEVAHVREDDLYRELLQSIADGTCEDPVECSKLALTTQDIEFSRWYA